MVDGVPENGVCGCEGTTLTVGAAETDVWRASSGDAEVKGSDPNALSTSRAFSMVIVDSKHSSCASRQNSFLWRSERVQNEEQILFGIAVISDSTYNIPAVKLRQLGNEPCTDARHDQAS